MSLTHAPSEMPRPLRLEWVAPDSLTENPRNWRRHPELQKEALAASLDECGWAGALLYNSVTNRLVDGHARRDEALKKGIPFVPVLVGAWTPQVEAKILATLDPIGALAQTDAAQLSSLLHDVETGNQALATLLTQLAEEAKLIPAAGDDGTEGTAGPPADESGAGGATGGEYALRVVCSTEARRTDLMASLRAEGYDVSTM